MDGAPPRTDYPADHLEGACPFTAIHYTGERKTPAINVADSHVFAPRLQQDLHGALDAGGSDARGLKYWETKMPRATLRCGGRSPVVGAWDAYSQIGCPTDQTRSRSWNTGCSSGEYISQDSGVPRTCLLILPFMWLLSFESDSAMRHKPRKDGTARPTISPPSSLRAVLVRRRKFFHA